MKNIKLLAGLALVGLLTTEFSAGAISFPAGKVNFKLTVLTQLSDSVTLRTNKSSAGTNIVHTITSRTKRSVLVNKDILKLLVNSLTNLPTTVITNGHVATDGHGTFFVVTPTTTNYVSNVISIAPDNWVFSGSETTITRTPPGTQISEIESATSTRWTDLTYDDSALTTRDGTHTSLDITGNEVTHWGDKNSDPKFTQTFEIKGNGDGTIQDDWVVITSATVTGSLKSSLDSDDF